MNNFLIVVSLLAIVQTITESGHAAQYFCAKKKTEGWLSTVIAIEALGAFVWALFYLVNGTPK